MLMTKYQTIEHQAHNISNKKHSPFCLPTSLFKSNLTRQEYLYVGKQVTTY